MTKTPLYCEIIGVSHEASKTVTTLTKGGTATVSLCKPSYRENTIIKSPMAILHSFGRIVAAYNFNTGIIVVFRSSEGSHLKRFETWLRAKGYPLKCTYFLYIRADRVGFKTFTPLLPIIRENHKVIRGNCVVYPYRVLVEMEDEGFEPFCNEFWGD